MEILSTSRNKIVEFYNKNPNLNFEDINEMIVDLFDNIINNCNKNTIKESQNNIKNEIFNIVKKNIDYTHVEELLNNVYKSAEIKKYSETNFIMSRENFAPIFIEIKKYNKNVPYEDVQQFINNINENNLCGIFFSDCGISNKKNFQIDIINNNVCLYIHDMNYDSDKIKLAVDIIDNIYSKLNIDTKKITINIETINLKSKAF